MLRKMLKNTVMEIIMGDSDRMNSLRRSQMIKQGTLRKISSLVYTTNMNDSADEIVSRNLFYILGQLYPHAVISHRSAFELKPTTEGHIYLTYKYTKKVKLPGIIVHLLEGPAGSDKDMPFIENLYISSRERRLLENLQPSRMMGGVTKCLPRTQIEEYLERILQAGGETALNELRDKSRLVADELEMQDEYRLLDNMIGALLSTRDARFLSSQSALSRLAGDPFDLERVSLFDILFKELKQQVFQDIEEPNIEKSSFRNFAFFESYFSNYIEGTEFELEDALQIIETGQPLPARNADSHDVLGTFQIVASRREMRRVPNNPDDLIDLLQSRHRVMMAARPDKSPGMFKMKNNRAGDTHFVDYHLVRGTLKKGFEYYQALEHPFSRALFMLFMISEVHPFTDGNGRISRIMMNAELVAANQSKIIIPTVFREDYLNSLRRLTRKREPSIFVRAMSRVREFSSNITGDDFGQTRQYLEKCNAFKDEDIYILRF